MKKEDFERLKAVCEKEGFGIQHFHTEETYHIWKKDIWDGVEFGLLVSQVGNCMEIGKTYKLSLLNDHGRRIWIDNGFLVPSTESAYIEQLKKEAHERFGEIKEGDRFERGLPNYRGEAMFIPVHETRYFKDGDEFHVGGMCIYQQGKWATRVKERVEVEMSECVANFGTYQPYTIEAKFTIKNVKDYDHANLPNFLRSQLEKYLNGEIE